MNKWELVFLAKTVVHGDVEGGSTSQPISHFSLVSKKNVEKSKKDLYYVLQNSGKASLVGQEL